MHLCVGGYRWIQIPISGYPASLLAVSDDTRREQARRLNEGASLLCA